ncbi:putative redox protein [Cognatiyoonia koreensis]|uniref:Putative redox protein n=1 Tax=Cognatiyoonia koreensis TaxID=364200 RepID=A0A1I0NQP8_9RHOB|nr:bifunctional alpha/beta hydrolase/OsmC family protein [Cognatiyoonia koreensis]SEW03665.1 putative redox protein [Cognatiyoonia koreensis]
MPTEKFPFTGHAGHTLAGRLERPAGPHLATALFAHCFTCSKDISAARRIATRLAAMGIAVLRFDFTGLGASDGDFADTSFTSNVEDLTAAAAALDAAGMAPSLLIGHSLGGAAVLKAAADMPEIKGVVTIGAPFDPAHVTHNFADALPEIEKSGKAEVSLAGRPFTIGKSFVDDVSKASLTEAIGKLRAALLVLHAPRDQTVGIENATQIYTAAKHPKSFVTLDGADHLVSDATDAAYAADTIATWAMRYLDLPEPEVRGSVPEGILRVTEADPSGFLQDVQSGPHHVLADEPASVGGTNQGLTPYGFLSAALGTCTSMTLRMYARRKGWTVTGISVDVSHAKSHADGQRIDNFTRVIALSGELDADQKAKLLEIADKCPVHKTLESGAHVTTRLA